MKKKILLSLVCCAVLPISTFAAPDTASVIQQTGSIDAQNSQIINRLFKERRFKKDIQQIENEDKQKSSIFKPQKNVQKAEIKEYATKGVYVKNITVSPSEILTEAEIKEIIDKYIEQNLKIQDIRLIVKEINTLYAQKGYVTAKAYLPEQKILNQTIKINLAEGRVGEISLVNNGHTKKKYILDRISFKKGSIFNISELEQDLVNFNRYNDGIKLNANLTPGEKEDLTTDINLEAKPLFPFHLYYTMDNTGRETIGKIRSGLILQHDNLFGYRDKLTFGSYFTKHSGTPFIDYNIPVNKKDGKVGFMYSFSKSHIANGDYSIFNIKSRSHNYSLYYNQPLIRKPYMELASYSSLGYKQATTSFDGYDLNTDKIPSLQTGLNYRYDTERGIWYANQNVYYAFPIAKRDINYVKIEGGITRLHDFGYGIIASLRGNYQLSPTRDIIPYIDQIQAGGLYTTRGYSEGLLIGRNGYVLSAELMFPIMPSTLSIKNRKNGETKKISFLGKFIKGALFIDHAGIFPYKGKGPGAEAINSNDYLLSAGAGVRIQLPNEVNARIYVGIPIAKNKYESGGSHTRVHFDISIAPNFEKLLSLRHPKKKVKSKIEEL